MKALTISDLNSHLNNFILQGDLRAKIPETKRLRARISPVSQGRKAGGKRRKVVAGAEGRSEGGEGGAEGEAEGGGEGGGEGEIVLLPCSHCRARTVVYPCTCKEVGRLILSEYQ